MRNGASWCPADKGGESGRASASPGPTCSSSQEPHPWARRQDEAAGRGPELCGCCLRAAGGGPGGRGLDVHVELARLLVVKVRVAGREAGGLRCACASVKGPSRCQCRASLHSALTLTASLTFNPPRPCSTLPPSPLPPGPWHHVLPPTLTHSKPLHSVSCPN